jgi:hypothetical protein
MTNEVAVLVDAENAVAWLKHLGIQGVMQVATREGAVRVRRALRVSTKVDGVSRTLFDGRSGFPFSRGVGCCSPRYFTGGSRRSAVG